MHPKARTAPDKYPHRPLSADQQRKIGEAHRLLGTRPPKAGRPWTDEEAGLLGKLPDAEVAQQTCRSLVAVRCERRRRHPCVRMSGKEASRAGNEPGSRPDWLQLAAKTRADFPLALALFSNSADLEHGRSFIIQPRSTIRNNSEIFSTRPAAIRSILIKATFRLPRSMSLR